MYIYDVCTVFNDMYVCCMFSIYSMRNTGRLSTVDKSGSGENSSGGGGHISRASKVTRCLKNGRGGQHTIKTLGGGNQSLSSARQRSVHHNRQNKGEDAKKARKQVGTTFFTLYPT